MCYLLWWWNAFRCWVSCSWDARFCVSTGWRHCCYLWETAWWYAQQTKVETQNFASHKHGYAIYWGDGMPFVAAFFCLWDAKFCVSTGRTPSLFHVKHSEMCGGILHCINMQRYFRKRINIHRQLHENAAGISESISGGKYASFERFC